MRQFSAALACLVVGFGATIAADPPNWKPIAVPDAWKSPPDGENIFQWYRASVKVPAEWKGKELLLVVEAVDDAREFYVGGEKIGSFGDLPPKYRSGLGETKRLKIDQKLVKFGEENLVAIRVCINQSRTGFNVAAPVLFGGDQAIRMAGQWEMTAGDDLAWAKADSKPAVAIPAFAKLESRADVEQSLKKLQNDEGPLSPEQSLAKCTMPDDLVATIVLSEPEIGQPLSIKWDTRGRMWVMQYLQYPNPAGLTMVSRDKFLRTVYDKVPPPPPNHFKGADKITIHEDTDGDGKFDKHKTFLDGLSLATSFAFGKGGVWVLNPPYLLFYPVKDGEDVPSGDPVVHLEGMGIEDSHSIASNLRWGPDGWLYASQGSTVTGDIKRPGIDKVPVHSLGQLIWRYHPEQKKYEIFAEGGGNTFGVEIDSKGRIYSGHNGGNTRGFHYVQGGYYQKGFGKHGALSNPYTFGYFEAMGHHNVQRFTHCFVIYDGGSLPEKYNGKLFGVVPLLSHVVMSDFLPDRSSFKTKDIGYALESKDPWFRPVDIQVGPDGAIYVADMYEQRIDHASHYQGRIDTKSGRIYRIAGKETKPVRKFDLGKEPTTELFADMIRPNKWFRQTAQEELMRRGNNGKLSSEISPQLEEIKGGLALELLWAINTTGGGLGDVQTLAALGHADPYVRLWAVRLACDDYRVSSEIAQKLADLAYREPNVEVRNQLACSARRLPTEQSLVIVKNLASRSEDVGDIHIPLLLWWAIEAKADASREEVLKLFADKAFWDQPMVAQHLSEKLMRRYGATGQRKDLLACAKLLELAPTKEHARKLMAGLESAYEGRSLANLPAELVTAITKAGATSPTLKLRQGDATAVVDALKLIADEKADVTRRQQFIQIFGTIQQPTSVPVLLKLAKESRNDALRSAALASLQSYKDETIGADVVALYKDLPEQVREVAQTLLSSRAAWSLLLVSAIDTGKIDKQTISDSTVQKLLLHGAPQITELCKKHFGETASGGASPEVVRQQLEKLTAIMSTASGNPYQGKKLFLESCGKCHKLFDDGGNIGPNLTTYKRDDLRGMLVSVLSPSAEIREGFENYLVRTADGRTLNGFIADQDPQVVVLKGADGQSISLARDDIEDMKAVKISIMPEGQLKTYSDQQIRDLFA
ncbi:MAG: c-type cytochrome, partial [Pirellulaceae bacterium]|nr:c-type cytochrome [Pirellulaceae bacterium]